MRRGSIAQELWYADIAIDALDVDSPFMRLGLVRYQPHAPRKLQVSEPVVEWIQILPERTVTAVADYRGTDVVFTIKTKGPASKRGVNENRPQASPAQRPLVRMMLLRRTVDADEAASSEIVRESFEASSEPVPGGLEWTQEFKLPAEEFHKPGISWSIFVEEVERLRPATYPDEPRYETLKDSIFAETGPRFSAKLGLDELRSPR
jgi:hypothetical protein